MLDDALFCDWEFELDDADVFVCDFCEVELDAEVDVEVLAGAGWAGDFVF